MKTDSLTAKVLLVRSVLVRMFQQTVVDESRKIFRLVEVHLPYSLSQVDDKNARPSAFDRLAQGLRQLDESEPDRYKYRQVLEDALSKIITDEVNKLLNIAEANTVGVVTENGNPTGLRVSFERETERKLSFIARKTAQANRKERGFYKGKTWAFRLLTTSVISAVLVTPFVFFNQEWAQQASVIFLILWVSALVSGLVSLVVFHTCQTWLEECSERYKSPEDWFAELIQHRAK